MRISSGRDFLAEESRYYDGKSLLGKVYAILCFGFCVRGLCESYELSFHDSAYT